MTEIHLEMFSLDDNLCVVPIETLITLFVMKYCDAPIDITLIKSDKENNLTNSGFFVDIKEFNYKILYENNSSCDLPKLHLNGNNYIAGLCSCLREIIKISVQLNSNNCLNDLLGFKKSCLVTCSETSVWTKYCEVDLLSTLKTFYYNNIISNNDNDNNDMIIYKELPINMIRFENHLSQPIRLHNINKYKMSKKYKNLDITLEHIYAEGSFMTLADLIIFICFYILFNLLRKNADDYDDGVFKLLPLTIKWYKRMLSNDNLLKSLDFIPLKYYHHYHHQQNIKNYNDSLNNKIININYILPITSDESLYRNDGKKKSSGNKKKYTRQDNVVNSLQLIKELNLDVSFDDDFYKNNDIVIDWSTIPYEATLEGGDLPAVRLKRKCEQLESLAIPVLRFAKPGDTIVDFCSGSGHLGILIAYLLPKCNVILLENKEESVNKSKKRIDKLKLNNVQIYQCNLDYFKGNFDIGMSLHACGVATDLVIQQCIKKNSIFICCPCCYGSVHNCHHINYPRSNLFKKTIDIKDYLVIGHAADQTHDDKNLKTKQGYECMSIIDTDRKLHAEQFGYNVSLTKLNPPTCTPKNNLLIGIPSNYKFTS